MGHPRTQGITMKIKHIVASALMFGCMSAAFAESVTLTADKDGKYTGYFGASHSEAFTDTYTFTPSFGQTSVSSILSSIGLTTASDIDFTSVTLNGIALTLVNGVSETAYTSSLLNLTGPLTLIVAGTSGSSASYSGSVNLQVLAVPEADTYAMLLAGLGLIGFIGRRRKAV
jgi:hypothetical protein